MPHPAAPIRSIAFCGISTGIYGYPLEAATKVAFDATRQWLELNHDKVDLIVFCAFLQKEWDCYTSLFPQYFPPCRDQEFASKYQEDSSEDEVEEVTKELENTEISPKD